MNREPGLRLIRDKQGIAFVLPAVGGGSQAVYLLSDRQQESGLHRTDVGKQLQGLLHSKVSNRSLSRLKGMKVGVLLGPMLHEGMHLILKARHLVSLSGRRS